MAQTERELGQLTGAVNALRDSQDDTREDLKDIFAELKAIRQRLPSDCEDHAKRIDKLSDQYAGLDKRIAVVQTKQIGIVAVIWVVLEAAFWMLRSLALKVVTSSTS